jgi:NADPH:quinone reductase-like Zn-dependent oxidoreductase
MKALVLKRYGGPDQVVFADLPRPVPKTGEILVQVHAVGLNPIDNVIPKGSFKPVLEFKLPATMGSDLSGVVVEVGAGVTRFKPGDEVFASIFDLGTGSPGQGGACVSRNGPGQGQGGRADAVRLRCRVLARRRSITRKRKKERTAWTTS